MEKNNWDKNESQEALYAYYLAGVEARSQVARQLLYGLLWATASVIAIILALQSSGPAIIWYGGLLVAPVHWYRAVRIAWKTRPFKSRESSVKEISLAGVIILLVALLFGSNFSVGGDNGTTTSTCWTDSKAGRVTEVPCNSQDATYVTESYSQTADGCSTGLYLSPSGNESRFTCISELP